LRITIVNRNIAPLLRRTGGVPHAREGVVVRGVDSADARWGWNLRSSEEQKIQSEHRIGNLELTVVVSVGRVLATGHRVTEEKVVQREDRIGEIDIAISGRVAATEIDAQKLLRRNDEN